MKVVKGTVQLFAAFVMISLLLACGGGGGGGGGGGVTPQSSSSSDGSTVNDGSYSITVDKTGLDFDVPFENTGTATQTIKITFAGTV